MRLLALALALALALPGCASHGDDARAGLVPYPTSGAKYAIQGAYVDFARWENAHPATSVAFAIGSDRPSVLDGARQIHKTFPVSVTVGGSPFATRYVDPATEGVVQAVYPLSQDQSVVAFDERGFPWLFGASALFGNDITPGAPDIAIDLPDNLGLGRAANFSWHPAAREGSLIRLDLVGNASLTGSLWMEPGSAWPTKAALTLRDAALAPAIRADGPLPATMVATRVEVTPTSTQIAPRDRSVGYVADAAARRLSWDGFAPPDGSQPYEPYALGDALRDAKLLDAGLQKWLASAQDARLYRATFKTIDAGVPGARNQTWLLQFVDRQEHYYATQMGRVDPPAAPAPAALPTVGVPRVESSGAVDAPASANHGWFAKDALPATLVPLGDAVAIMKGVFGAKDVQIFLRSFAQPPGYSYFLDGGWDGPGGEKGRYTVVYNPETAFLEEATGPVSARLG